MEMEESGVPVMRGNPHGGNFDGLRILRHGVCDDLHDLRGLEGFWVEGESSEFCGLGIGGLSLLGGEVSTVSVWSYLAVWLAQHCMKSTKYSYYFYN